MKHFYKGTIIAFLIVHLFLNIGIAQQTDVKLISEDEFLENYQVYSFNSYIPKDKLPDNVEEAHILINGGGETAQLIFKEGNTYKIFPEIKADFTYNFAKRIGSDYKNGEILISSQIPFSAVYSTGHFKLEGNQLIFLKEDYYDPNASVMAEADQALADGDIKTAAELYMDKMYPPIGYYESIQEILLKRAHSIALIQSKNKDYKKACETIGYAYDFYFFDEESDILADKEIIQILSDYSYFLDNAELYEQCIKVSELICAFDNNATGPYLHLGDSYYHTNMKKLAAEAYKTYISRRKEQGKTIPFYVRKRLGEIEKNSGK